jgi:hypothetical protein
LRWVSRSSGARSPQRRERIVGVRACQGVRAGADAERRRSVASHVDRDRYGVADGITQPQNGATVVFESSNDESAFHCAPPQLAFGTVARIRMGKACLVGTPAARVVVSSGGKQKGVPEQLLRRAGAGGAGMSPGET